MKFLQISFGLIVYILINTSLAQEQDLDSRVVFRAVVQDYALQLHPSDQVGVEQRDLSAVQPTRSFVSGRLQCDQSLVFTGKPLGRVTPHEGECLLKVQLPWQNAENKVRSLLDIKFNSGDQTGLALIGDTIQVYGLFGGTYRHAFFRGLKYGPDTQVLQVVLAWIYADGYTLVTLRINDDEVASLVSGLGKGEVESIELAGRSGTGKSELEPLVWHTLELAKSIRWQMSDEVQDLPVSAQLLERRKGLTLWTQNATRQVRLNQSLPEMQQTDRGQINIARGETHALQLVLTSQRDLENVQISSENWLTSDGQPLGQQLSDALSLELRWVEHVQVAFPSGRFGGSGVWPDPLPPINGPLQVKANENRSIWISVKAAHDALPGKYHTTIQIQHGQEVWHVPLQVTVRKFALPMHPTLDTVARLNSRFMPEGEEELYYRNLSEHRINGLIGASAVERLVRPTITTDQLRKAKAHVNLIVNELHFDYVSLSGIGWVSHRGTHLWPDHSRWAGIPHFRPSDGTEMNPRFNHSFKQHIKKVIQRLSSVTEMKHFMFFYQDEMSWNDPKTLKRSVNMAKYLKKIAPQISILQSKYPTPQLNPYVDYWCIHADHATQYDVSLRDVQSNQAKVWLYHNTIPAIDYPSIRSRLYPWLLNKLGYDGSFSYWSVNEWLEDPWKQKWSGIAGSGVLLYPGREQDEPGPISSIRWEMLRDGLEDVEYLNLLQDALKHKKMNSQQTAIAKQLLQQSQEMTQKLPRVVGLGDQPYCLDVVKLETLRNAIGDLLDELSQ